MMDRCRRTAGLLDVVLAEGDLTADELAHVAGCPACARALAEARAFGRELSRVGQAVTPEPMPEASTLLIARELERRETSPMRIRPTLTLVVAGAGIALAIASLFLLKPVGTPEVASTSTMSPSTGSHPQAGSQVPVAGLSPEEAAPLLGVRPDQVISIPGGAVATRLGPTGVELVGVTLSSEVFRLGVAEVPQAGIIDDATAGGIVCTGGPFAGAAFVFGATSVTGEVAVPMLPGTLAVSAVELDDTRTFTLALDPTSPRRTWAMVQRKANGDGTSVGSTFIEGPCDGTDPSGLREAASRQREADRVAAARIASDARTGAPASAALVGIETCDGATLARFWAPQGSSAGMTVLDGEAAMVTGPDAPEVARQRAREGRFCRALPGATTQSDLENLPSLDRAFGALNAEHSVNPFSSRIAYLGPTELVVETHSPAYAADRNGPLEYIGVVRRDASGWRLAGVKSTDHIDGAAGIGLVRLDALDGAQHAYAAVYGVPATLAPVAVDIIVAGVAYRYAIAEDGFLAVVPAEVGQAVTYRYRNADGTVVEEGVVPE